MRLWTKAVFAAGCAVFVAVPVALPADAQVQEDEVQGTFEFTRHGQQVACTTVGRSSHQYVLFGGDGKYKSIVVIETALVDSDPACHAAVNRTDATAYLYRRDPVDVAGLVQATSPDSQVRVQTIVDPVTRVDAVHLIFFDCDNPVDADGCGFDLETSPK